MGEAVNDVRAAVEADALHVIEDLKSMVSVPGIAFDGFPVAELDRARATAMDLLRRAGYARVWEEPVPGGAPAVFAETPGPAGAPTVLLYAHYDVQPAGDLDAWDSPPFEPTVRDGRLYGRGAADDKSGVVMHAAMMRVFGGKPPVTLRVVLEGEEEYDGSRFAGLVAAKPDLFAADVIVIADVGNAAKGKPTFVTALRGLVDATVTVETLAGPVHSGMYGGPAPDALMVLVTMLATLRDTEGNCAVAIPGSEWTGVDFDEDEYRDVVGVLPGQPLVGTGSVASRLVSMPTVNVVGLDAPPVHGAINAIVPRARAKVSLRIPPGVDPSGAMQALVAHLEGAAPWGVSVDVAPGAAGAGFSVDTSVAAYELARRAMAEAYGVEVGEMGAGGTIPLVQELAEAFPDAALFLMGAQDPLARIHAPNESVDLEELRHATLAQALFLAHLGAGSAG